MKDHFLKLLLLEFRFNTFGQYSSSLRGFGARSMDGTHIRHHLFAVKNIVPYPLGMEMLPSILQNFSPRLLKNAR